MKRDDPRALALRILEEVEGTGAFADTQLGRTLAGTRLDPRDAALLTRLVYGTIAWQLRLDWTLEHLAARPITEIDAPVVATLRLGLLQILFLERVPAHAAVNTSVDLARARAGGGAARFVNAILRRALREGERPPPDAARDPVRHLSIVWSHPLWLVESLGTELGLARTARLLEAHQQAAPTCLRINLNLESRDAALARLRALGLDVRAGRFADTAILLDSPLGRIGQGPTQRAAGFPADARASEPALRSAQSGPSEQRGTRRPGRSGPAEAEASLGVAFQSEASQLAAAALGVRPGERVADLCAAPGGKTGALACGLDSNGQLVAADLTPLAVRTMGNRLGRAPGLGLLCQDGRRPALRHEAFDAVLLDAPCTGLGTLRQHPEIRWRRQPADIERAHAIQLALLVAAADLVRPAGRLVYATCTLGRRENDDVVASFLAHDSRFVRDPIARWLPAAALSLIDPDQTLRTAPDLHGLDGFFAVRLVRRADM